MNKTDEVLKSLDKADAAEAEQGAKDSAAALAAWSALPEFGFVPAACPKCRAVFLPVGGIPQCFTTEFCEGDSYPCATDSFWSRDRDFPDGKCREWMSHSCQTCGWTWRTKCADAEKEGGK